MNGELLLLVDGHSLFYRAFHAVPPLATRDGVPTNAVFGFTNMLLKVLSQVRPRRVAVAFDCAAPTFRHREFEEYKANRPTAPPELRLQLPLLKEVLQAMRIPVLELEGYEADDLIGALVAAAEEAGQECLILTGDSDALQLVSPSTKVLLTRKGISVLETYDEARVRERYGVAPGQLPDLRGLVGDASDNIPGVPGIGPKTAARLLREYPDLEEIVRNADRLPSALRERIAAFSRQALLAKRLATVSRSLPGGTEVLISPWHGPDHEALLEVFRKLEFRSLIREVLQGRGAANGRGSVLAEAKALSCYRPPYRRAPWEELRAAARAAGEVALALAGDRKGGVQAAAVATGPDDTFLLDDPAALRPFLEEICADPAVKKICHDAKDAAWLLRPHGTALTGLAFDTRVAAYLLNPGAASQDLPSVALEHAGLVLPPAAPDSLAAGAQAIWRLRDNLHGKLRLTEQEDLYCRVELPLVGVLTRMEMAGVAVDAGQLRALSAELEGQLAAVAEVIYGLAGERFNINSTRQLGQVLFERLGLPAGRRTKTGYGTDARILEELAAEHEIVRYILEYRQLAQLKSTYVDGLLPLIDSETGLLHTVFHQTVTATGRLSSSEPNLQNIPWRLAAGRRVRRAFVPRRPGNVIMTADYSQIELRILAHFSRDPGLLEAFREGRDVHARTAAEVFGVPEERVTPEMRRRAKAVNFGIVYGISDFGLARDLKISRAEARGFIDRYLSRHPGVRAYMERAVAAARERGYTTTILNRRRYLPELFSPDRATRGFGERAAINTPIQGSAADIIKLAMVRLDHALESRRLAALLVLQVHDELILDVPGEEVPEVKQLVKEHMENAVRLDVPLPVEVSAGPSWYEVTPVP
ncbi:MAG: DNA polymerase I [Firmicutes bacterium]|nr:DNA polymerase I [Bacillota bacterium]